ncbi:helix-turn-helix transcriptional regulator [Streptococcus castoreus]|uniref:helix-turn-helix transcriptional regulator n=1 Tax=Streptococcus castoreus TaxID=254786 RepID=UPI000420B891|nr:AraC family transcriptional regulator [Streptococcus castoreus]
MKNPSYIFYYISTTLRTNLSIVQNGVVKQRFCQNLDLCSSYKLIEEEVLQIVIPLANNIAEPKFIVIERKFLFTLVKSEENTYYVIGPIQINELSSVNLQTQSVNINKLLLDHVPLHDIWTIVDLSLLLHNLFHDFEITREEIWLNNISSNSQEFKTNTTQLLFTNREIGHHHNSYQQELREQEAIISGNLVKLRQSWEGVSINELGVLADNELRSYRNLAIVVIALATRSAIRGGVTPEIAYSLSDNLIRNIEKLETTNEILTHIRQSEIDLTLLVKQAQKVINNSHNVNDETPLHHPYIRKTQDYIARHLHETITLEDLANVVPCSASYLSKLYHNNFNKSIQVYISEERCRYAEELLLFTDKSISEIATSLGYTSQSYFGKVFKKYCNYSPYQYRLKFSKLN